MSDPGHGYRRFDGEHTPAKPTKRALFGPIVFAVLWVAMMVSFLIKELSGTPDWVRICLFAGIGVVGLVFVLRRVIRTFREMQ
jgi:hypothetical protein